MHMNDSADSSVEVPKPPAHRTGVVVGSWPLGMPSDPRFYRRIARVIEDAGFDSLFVGDHVFAAGPIPDACATLAAFAAQTEHIAIGSAVLLVPLREPCRHRQADRHHRHHRQRALHTRRRSGWRVRERVACCGRPGRGSWSPARRVPRSDAATLERRHGRPRRTAARGERCHRFPPAAPASAASHLDRWPQRTGAPARRGSTVGAPTRCRRDGCERVCIGSESCAATSTTFE